MRARRVVIATAGRDGVRRGPRCSGHRAPKSRAPRAQRRGDGGTHGKQRVPGCGDGPRWLSRQGMGGLGMGAARDGGARPRARRIRWIRGHHPSPSTNCRHASAPWCSCFRAPPSYGDFLDVSLQRQQVGGTALPRVPIEPKFVARTPDGWTEANRALLPARPNRSIPFDRIAIPRAGEPWAPIGCSSTRCSLPDPGTGASGGPPLVRKAKFAIHCDQPATPINP